LNIKKERKSCETIKSGEVSKYEKFPTRFTSKAICGDDTRLKIFKEKNCSGSKIMKLFPVVLKFEKAWMTELLYLCINIFFLF
jgi:hypothetical protein